MPDMRRLAPEMIAEPATSIAPTVRDRPGKIATNDGAVTRIRPSLAASATNHVASTVTAMAARVGTMAFNAGTRCAADTITPTTRPRNACPHSDAQVGLMI